MKPKVINERRVGNTTRLIDYYVQELFNNRGSTIKIKDHIEFKDKFEIYDSFKCIARIISSRLYSEHNLRPKNITVSFKDYTIKLNKI